MEVPYGHKKEIHTRGNQKLKGKSIHAARNRGYHILVWKVATNPEGAAKTQLFKKSPSRYPWSKMQNGQQNAGRSATLEIYALLLGMGKWRGTSAKAIQGVPKGIKRTDTKKSAEKSRESGS